MITQHDALYRAICAEPDEDTPRLAFADLVEEEGDPTRAAFIRTQIALARATEYEPVYISAKQLTPDALHGWMMAHTLPKVPGGYGWNTFEFRRGFPWKTRLLSLASFVNSGDALFGVAPIQALDVDANERPNLVTLAECPHLAKIRRLEFSHGRFGANAITRLGDSANANGLLELAFGFDSITAAGLEALALSDVFPRLESLELRTSAIPPALLVDSLGAADRPGHLGRLSLASNLLTEDDADHLFALPILHGLHELDLSDNKQLGVQGVESLAGSGALRGLRVLRLRNTRPGRPGMEALTSSSGFGSLRSLDLAENRLGPVAVKLIAESKAAKGLRVLNLANNPIGDAGATAIANSRAFAGLLELDLGNTDLTDAGARVLAESPHLGNLLRLNLASGRPFGDAAREALTERFGKRVSCA